MCPDKVLDMSEALSFWSYYIGHTQIWTEEFIIILWRVEPKSMIAIGNFCWYRPLLSKKQLQYKSWFILDHCHCLHLFLYFSFVFASTFNSPKVDTLHFRASCFWFLVFIVQLYYLQCNPDSTIVVELSSTLKQ